MREVSRLATVVSHTAQSSASAVAGQPSIAVQHVTHRYGDRAALQDLSFEVGRSEIFGLLGPNGSGKTTLFRILSTLMIPSQGRCAIAGFDVGREPQRVRSHIGIVFQAKSVD